MDSKDRRRQARLQGLHNVRLPKTCFVSENETAFEQPKCRDEIDNVSSTFLEDENCHAFKNREVHFKEMQMTSQPEVRNCNKNSRGRKSTQRNDHRRGDFHSSKRSDRKNFSYDRRPHNSNGNVDDTAKYLNELKINDALNGGQISGEARTLSNKDPPNDITRSYCPRTMRQSSYKKIQGYMYNKEERYSPKSRSNFGRGRSYRGMRTGPNCGRTSDESTFKESSVARSFHNGVRAQSGQYNFINYEPNGELKTDSCNDKTTNGSYKKQGIRSTRSFVYEETNQGENISLKTTGTITLNIIGWHKLVQRKPEDKESYLYFKPDFLEEEERENYFQHLKQSIKWQEKEIIIRGEKYMQPRLVAWYGPLPYSYSNAVLEANCEFPPVIMDIKERIENILKKEQKNVTFNSVLLNMYRDGKDSVAWHSDDELSMGIHPTIASISLGETRRFEMKLKQDRKEERASPQVSEEYVIHLTSGSLLIMDGAMQEYWLHRVPKEFHDRTCRINLTFRTVYPIKEKEQKS